MSFDIDYVLPYVNPADPVWKEQHDAWVAKHRGKTSQDTKNRYEDFGFFKYVFRGIAKNMPWIRKVHLIVESQSQVPEWINQNEVHIVYHRDIMPEEILPTYNSQTIEMFLHKIEGLADHFIYANDDMYVISPSKPSDWFADENTIKMNMKEASLPPNPTVFQSVIHGEWKELKRRLVRKPESYSTYWRPSHDITPVIKSHVTDSIMLLQKNIEMHLGALRAVGQHNQYLFTDYAYLTGRCVPSERNFKYFSTKNVPQEVAYEMCMGHLDTIVLNDSATPKRDEWIRNPFIIAAFYAMFSTPCKYEKQPKFSALDEKK